jgi:rare lipoprotein A
MKTFLSGTSAVLLGLIISAPVRADSGFDSFGGGDQYRNVLGAGERAATGRGSLAGRSNLGASSFNDDAIPSRRSRVARASVGIEDGDDVARGQRSRSGRRVAASRSYGGGSSGGVASYYWQRQRVASGGWFNPSAMTAAHKTLPFGTRVRVTNRHNGRSAVVTINDRGPYIAGRVIDLSRAAAGAVGMIGQGLARVTLEVLGR